MKSLAGKVVAITGASSGIGAATALALAGHKARLVISARRMDKLELVAQQARVAGAEVLALSCDVGQYEQVQAMVANCVEKFGRLDVMIANAGFGLRALVHETTAADFEEIVRVNLTGTWYCMAEAAPVMLRQHAGHIIVISSAAGRRGLPLFGAYSMTKAGQLSLAEAMRVELRGTGVYVSSVHPVTTETEFFTATSKRAGVKVSGVGAAQTAECVAKKIVRLIEKPKPELWPMGASRIGLSFSTLLPGLTDYFMRKQVPKRQAQRIQTEPATGREAV